MRAVFTFLVMLGLVWCGTHLGGQAEAHAFAPPGAEASSPVDAGGEHEGVADATHGGHHHCPLAPEPARHAMTAALPLASPDLLAATSPAMPSWTPAPPIEPPTA